MEKASGTSNTAQPAIYPAVEVIPDGRVSYRDNHYSLFSQRDQNVLFEALKLRCHSEERLHSRRYLTPTKLATQREGLYVQKGIDVADIVATPSPHPARGTKRRVVALDCEMVGVLFGEGDAQGEVSELGQLCAVDVLTGEILIDVLVQPSQRVINWRTRWSGLTYFGMRSARNAHRLLAGWRSARAELFKHIDSDTILVGQDLSQDLFMLRLAHNRVVDTAIQTAEAVFNHDERIYRTWGLKILCRELMRINIQVGKKGHDCVEDTLATRELALWCVCLPAVLDEWAQGMREKLERETRTREEEGRSQEGKGRREEEEAGGSG